MTNYLTKEQVIHVNQLIKSFAQSITAKYEAGVKEHGGNLWEKPITYLLDEAIMENIDQFVYLMTLRQKLESKGIIDVK